VLLSVSVETVTVYFYLYETVVYLVDMLCKGGEVGTQQTGNQDTSSVATPHSTKVTPRWSVFSRLGRNVCLLC